MKTREEYENLCDKTFSLVGDAQAKRMEIDLLLDIRDLLIWFKEKELYEQIVAERVRATRDRINSIKEEIAL